MGLIDECVYVDVVLQDAVHEHLTDEDRGKIKASCREAEEWVASNMERQSKLPVTADPVVLIKDFEQTRKVRVCVGVVALLLNLVLLCRAGVYRFLTVRVCLSVRAPPPPSPLCCAEAVQQLQPHCHKAQAGACTTRPNPRSHPCPNCCPCP